MHCACVLDAFKMDDIEVVSYFVLFLAFWLFYGFKWAILVVFTIVLIVYTLRNYTASNSVGVFRQKGSKSSAKYDNCTNSSWNDEADVYSTTQQNVFTGEESTMSRRYVNPVLTKQDLPFTDLQMNRNSSARRGNSLRSPQPLISHVNRHLSFSNTSYYPEQTRSVLRIKNRQRAILDNSRSTIGFDNTTAALNSSHLLSPLSSANTSHNYNISSSLPSTRQPSYNIASSPAQAERYSPRCFSLIDPNVNMAPSSPSIVKISQPSDSADGSPSFESILQKRLQKTEKNPCSRHSVLSALSQKNTRKRPAVEAPDGSFLESVYSVKKRRRDDLDKFLDTVSSPAQPPARTSFYRSLRRPGLRSDTPRARQRSNDYEVIAYKFENPTIPEQDHINLKNPDYAVTAYKHENSPSKEKETTATTRDLQSKTKLAISADIGTSSKTERDSGVVPDNDHDDVMPTAKKAKKSVTFSKETKRSCEVTTAAKSKSGRQTKSDTGSTRTAQKEVLGGKTSKQKDDRNEASSATESESTKPAKARFFSESSLHSTRLSPIVKPKKTKVQLKSNLTWKDLQQNRQEAWNRSKKLLDEVEESVARETGATSNVGFSNTRLSIPETTTGAIASSVSTQPGVTMPSFSIPATTTTNTAQPPSSLNFGAPPSSNTKNTVPSLTSKPPPVASSSGQIPATAPTLGVNNTLPPSSSSSQTTSTTSSSIVTSSAPSLSVQPQSSTLTTSAVSTASQNLNTLPALNPQQGATTITNFGQPPSTITQPGISASGMVNFGSGNVPSTVQPGMTGSGNLNFGSGSVPTTVHTGIGSGMVNFGSGNVPLTTRASIKSGVSMFTKGSATTTVTTATTTTLVPAHGFTTINNPSLKATASRASNFMFGSQMATAAIASKPALTTTTSTTMSVTAGNPPLFNFGSNAVSTNPVTTATSGSTPASGFQFAVPTGSIKSSSLAVAPNASSLAGGGATSSVTTLQPFSGFGAPLGGSGTLQTTQNLTSSFAFKSTPASSSTFQQAGIGTTAAIAQNITTVANQPTAGFSFLGQSTQQSAPTSSMPSVIKPNLQSNAASQSLKTFSFNATVPQTAPSTGVAGGAAPAFNFQSTANPGQSLLNNQQPQSALQASTFLQAAGNPQAKSSSAGLFTFTASNPAGFGASNAGSTPQKTSMPASFSFGSQSAHTTVFGGAAQPKSTSSGGFTFSAAKPAAKPPQATGFAFNQPSPATGFTFGSPAPPGGFTFSAAPGPPFASSTPMPGSSGVMPPGGFAFSSSGTTSGSVVTKGRQRRRTKK